MSLNILLELILSKIELIIFNIAYHIMVQNRLFLYSMSYTLYMHTILEGLPYTVEGMVSVRTNGLNGQDSSRSTSENVRGIALSQRGGPNEIHGKYYVMLLSFTPFPDVRRYGMRRVAPYIMSSRHNDKHYRRKHKTLQTI